MYIFLPPNSTEPGRVMQCSNGSFDDIGLYVHRLREKLNRRVYMDELPDWIWEVLPKDMKLYKDFHRSDL